MGLAWGRDEYTGLHGSCDDVWLYDSSGGGPDSRGAPGVLTDYRSNQVE